MKHKRTVRKLNSECHFKVMLIPYCDGHAQISLDDCGVLRHKHITNGERGRGC